MKPIKLRTKITISVSLLITLVIVICFGIGLFLFESRFKKAIAEQQFAMLATMADEVDSKIFTSHNELIAVAKKITPDILADRSRAQKFLEERDDTSLLFDSGLYIFLPNGQILAGTMMEPHMWGGDYSYRDYFKKTMATGRPQISNPFISTHSNGHPLVIFTAPVYDSRGGVAAFMAGCVDLLRENYLGKLARLRIGGNGFYFVLTPDRRLVIHPQKQRVLTEVIGPGRNLLLDRAIAGFEGGGETVTSYGVAMVSSYKRLKSVDWIMAASQPQAEVYELLGKARIYLVVGVLLVLLVSLYAVRLMLGMLVRPLDDFTEHVRRVAAAPGDDHPPFHNSSRDEINELAEAFDKMLEALDSQRKTVQEQVTFLQTLIDTIPNPIFYKDAQARYLGCNGAFEQYLGKTREQLLGKTVYDLAPKELADVYHRSDAELFTKGGVQVYEASVKYADGGVRDVIFYKAVFHDAEGSLGGLVGTFLDITERKRMESALAEQRDFTENLVLNSPIPTFVLNSRHQVIFWNRACEKLTGVSAGELLGTNHHWQAFYGRERPCLADLVLNGESGRLGEYYLDYGTSDLIVDGVWSEGWFHNLGGKNRFVLFSAAPLRNSAGEVIGALETLEDITERKSAEEQLRKFSQAIEQSPASIVITNLNGDIEYVNPKFTEVTGYAAEEVLGQNPRILKAGDKTAEFYREMWETLVSGREWRGEFQNRKKNGEIYWEYALISPLKSADGKITHFIAAKEDISERKKLEQQLRHAQKMEAIGTLSGGIAHDFNNILTAIIGYANLMQLKLVPDDPSQHYVEQLLAAADKATSLTKGLLAYSRKQPIALTSIDVNDVVRKVDKLLTRLIGEGIELSTVLADESLVVQVDGNQIEQVLMNLAINARDALEGAGSLVIETRRVSIAADFIERHGYGELGDYAMIAVSDTGTGMDAATRERIFEPFFTTKEVGQGTGLGLSIVYGIVKQHQGYIDVYSEPGEGTTFKLYLPLSRQSDRRPETVVVAPPQGGGETILLVEDNAGVSHLARAVLEEFGYRVLVAGDGEAGVACFAEHRDGIDLVILDVIMPKKNGKQVYDEIRQMRPDVKAIFTSGYTAEIIDRQGIMDEGLIYLQKPLMPRELLAKVREVLDS